MSIRTQKGSEVFRVDNLETLKNRLKNNYGRSFEIYITSNIEIGGVLIESWTVFNFSMPASDDVFAGFGVQVGNGNLYAIYGTNTDNISAVKY